MRIFVFIILAGIGCPLFAQENKPVQIELINANTLEFDEYSGIKAKRLIGDVQFMHEGAKMYCDSAYLFEESNSLNAFSNVRIIQGDSIQLYGDSLYYNGNTKEATIKYNVRFHNKSTTLTTDFLKLDREKKLTYYYGGGTMINNEENNRLTSQTGYYYTESKSFYFKDSVVLKNPDYTMISDTLEYQSSTEVVRFHGPTTIETKDSTTIYCESGYYNTITDHCELYRDAMIMSGSQTIKGDSIFYNQKTGYGLIKCFAEIADTAEHITVYGDKAVLYDEQDSATITENAYIAQIADDDTLYMHADTLQIYPDSTGERQLFGYHSVRIFKKDMQGRCDSMYYSFRDSTLEMHYEPILWSDESQITGTYMEIMMKQGEIHSLFIEEESFIASKVDSIRYNQIKGKSLQGRFADGKLVRIYIEGNGESIYFALDDKEKYIGMNMATSSNILIRLKDSKISKITFEQDPTATLSPIDQVSDADSMLEGFQWLEDIRPGTMLEIFE